MIVIMITAWMTATFLIEAISVSCAKKYNGRTNSVFNNPLNQSYIQDVTDVAETPKLGKTDPTEMRKSPFFIRSKIEMSTLANEFVGKWL